MSHQSVYPVPASAAQRSHLTNEQYMQMYQQSVSSPDSFWAEHGKRLHWFTPFTNVKQTSFVSGKVNINWFNDGVLNASYNCLDRHLPERADQVAYFWEGDSPDVQKSLTYAQLHQQVCQLANGMKALGVTKGDKVTIYLPMIPEATVALLACARIGAVHSVVFAGFSPDALGSRIVDCDSKLVITADQSLRGSRVTNLKDNTDMALAHLGDNSPVQHVIVVKHVGKNVDMNAGKDGRDVWYHDLLSKQSSDCPAEPMKAEDPLFILYTSGSTGKPKGVLHTTGGYMVWASMTHQYVFDYHEGDIYWCAADIGWVTGHTYIVYGPLANGATSVLFEGVPNYPSVKRMAQIVDKYKVNILYTAPTAIRALMAHGDAPVDGCSLSSLQTLGSVGEPINPEAWSWYHEKFGKGNCPIVDTWWQTETGGILITPLPGCTALKPGSATRPFFGVKPAIVDNEGNELNGECEGNLVIKDSWPGQMRTVYGDHERFEQTYFSTYPGMYFTGDGAKRDADGYYWLTGRVDDVLNISGHRLGTAEIESCLVAHDAVAEAAVVGYPHDIKGQGIYVYVTPRVGVEPSAELTKALRDWVREEISPIAAPDLIQWAPTGLPKTRSGKIMRRILRKIAANEHDQLGDISTLADPSVVETLVNNRLNRK
ncbi:acetate--CoA ligase [Rheinheimera baltica]|uniref:Acetyl-coenzyme A synthetase n=2 Tax=Rheinheimera baltica TaxID=67576 RepID=A0ABT9HXJ9_9GAMM|nr:acetate--CoA ligase [Rheinheimera baltica]MDP5135406.1 acetate--CoA ligase [Rheinheimera baltica]MDP5144522.1 acetate--CoA ligase [Rheinheimera baltica]MDP5149129.1 acetate--CoA ligase [Rheinheimera baltica]